MNKEPKPTSKASIQYGSVKVEIEAPNESAEKIAAVCYGLLVNAVDYTCIKFVSKPEQKPDFGSYL